ncbi:hypothetical protein OE88DRAFT_837654 [Heliocybe sulcata]|uniref:Uncharacterized protein n=1 Tax=Heliocybe sulcata TaxID=5364 RepID=A0A5C3MNF5_9AGAM|nr:hypothetical protein OE88DRAFT_837654 [Heliocybe sulcata]
MDDTAFIAVMGTQLAHYARENADLRKRVEELEQVIAASGLGHAQVDVTRLEEVERERDRLQQELRTTTLTVEQTRRENERLAEEYQLRCRTLEMEVCDLRTDRDKVKHAWRKTISELDRLTKETEGLQELSSLKNQLSEVAEDNNRTKEERENICRELLKSVQTVKSLRIAKVDLQQAADKALEERDQLVDQHNQRLANESEAHARQLADCKKTYEQQLWTLQADYARQFLHEKEAYARQLAEEREVHEHQVTKLHADLCEQIKLVDKTRTSYIELGNENASLRYEAERAHKLEAQVCELRIQLRATITQHDDMKTELANMVVTLSHMDHEKNDAQNAAEAGRRAEADRCGLLKKLQQIAAENEGLARQLDTVRADAAEKSRLLDSTTARVERSQQELQELRAGLEEDKEGRAELEKEYARAVDQLVDRESELAECVASLEKMREEKSIVDQVMEELKDVCPSWQELPRLVHELSSNKETLAQTLTELEGDATQKEASLRETTAALDKAREESSSLREELKVSLDTVASFQPLHLQVGLLNQQVTSLQAELDTRGAAIADLQSKSTSANSAYEVSVSRLAEETATKNECERRREEACQEVYFVSMLAMRVRVLTVMLGGNSQAAAPDPRNRGRCSSCFNG